MDRTKRYLQSGITALLVGLLAAGCATTVKHTSAPAPGGFLPASGSVTSAPVSAAPATKTTPTTAATTTTTMASTSTTNVAGLVNGIPAPLAPAAEGYVTVTQNFDSAYQPQPTSWLAEIKPYVTTDFYASLSKEAGDNTDADWSLMHANGWKVLVTVRFSNFTYIGTSQASVLATPIDTTVTLSGKPVPGGLLPQFAWPYSGPQTGELLVMQETSGGQWLVANQE